MTSRTSRLIVPVFIPQQGCPHQCVFCNQKKITGAAAARPDYAEIEAVVDQYRTFPKTPPTVVELAFFGGNFLGLSPDVISRYMAIVHQLAQTGRIHRLRFSTRPDTIVPERLHLVTYPDVTIEIGVQSMDDEVLKKSRRGHSAADTVQAAARIKALGFEMGLQIMVGLPGAEAANEMVSAIRALDLAPDFFRIYPTVVLANSLLAKWTDEGTYRPLSVSEAVTQVKTVFLKINGRGIPVIRMGLQPSSTLDRPGTVLAGPYHPAFGQLVYSEIILDRIMVHLSDQPTHSTINLTLHSGNISTLRGQKNRNLQILKNRYPAMNLSISGTSQTPRHMIMINDVPVKLWEPTPKP